MVNNHPGEWMYEQPSWVLTHRPHIIADGHPVQAFDGDVAELHPKLVSAAAGKDVWVVGGGDVAAQFVAAGLIDEMIVTLCAVLARRRLAAAADPHPSGRWSSRASTATSSAPGGARPSGRRLPAQRQAVTADEFP